MIGIGLMIGALPLGAAFADVAQPIPDTPAAREADEIFQQLLKDPKNVDLTLRYATAALKAGNIEGAISSLERLLLIDRNFPGVKIQLAELYARIHSYDMAKTYLTQAEEEPGADPKMQARIEAVREEIDKATSKSGISTNLLVGIRHQSNGSAEPAGSEIVAGGIPQTLSTIYIHQRAWDLFATGNVQYIATLGGVTIESNALAYYSRALGHGVLDLGAVELNSGPRFDIDIGDAHLFSARPYGLANEVTLGESEFLHSAGAGLEIDRSITDKLGGSAFYEFRDEWFSNVALSPSASTMNGDVHSFGTALSYHVLENGDLALQVSYALTDNAETSSNRGLVVHLSYAQLFELPASFGVGPLDLSPSIYRIYSRDTGPDSTAVPPFVPLTDEWRYGVTAKLGFTNNIAGSLGFVRQTAASNVEANKTSNTQIILGVTFSY